MSGLSKLGTALIIIFVISLVALFVELFYVLWRRRVFHRQSQSPPLAAMQGSGAADSNSHTFSATSFSSSSSFSSKELYFFFFCNNSRQISRVEPTSSTPPSVNSAGSCPEDEMEEVIDVFKLQNMYGPSRVLFTIKEEERENDVESDKDKSLCSSAEKGTARKHNTSKRVNLEDCFKTADDESTPQMKVEVEVAVAVAVGDDQIGGNEITPFSTPCESPLYFTPSASPTRELIDSVQTGNVLGNEQTMSSMNFEL